MIPPKPTNLNFEASEQFLEYLKKMWSRYPKPMIPPFVNHKRAFELYKNRILFNCDDIK